MASTILNRTPSSTGDRKKWTLSMWIKNSNLKGQGGSSYQRLYQADGDNEYFRFTESTGKLLWLTNNGSSGGFLTTRVFRDSNAWYHLVLRIDTTLGTAGDRSRLYVNGVEETEFDTENQVAQNYDTYSNYSSKVMQFGGYSTSDQNYNGCMSHIHLCDGYSYAPTEFGETDSTTGEWKIKTSPSVSYGTNGFFILKDGNSVTDQSGQGNNLTVSGTLTKTEDCPTNIFCTNDVNGGNSGSITIGWGASSAYRASAGFRTVTGTLGASAGKYYAECKINGVGTNGIMVGFVNLDTSNIQNATQHIGEDSASSGIYSNAGQIYYGNASNFANTGAYSAGDIIQLAMDIDNGYLYYGKNGTWLNSSDPTSGSTGTGGLALSNLSSNGSYSFATSVRDGGDARWNFGNGYFEVTAVSSAGTNASGNGIFEYDVPSGYTALCTKGLNA